MLSARRPALRSLSAARGWLCRPVHSQPPVVCQRPSRVRVGRPRRWHGIGGDACEHGRRLSSSPPCSTASTGGGNAGTDVEVPPVEVHGSSEASVTSLVNDFTSPALAAALLDREATLRKCHHELSRLALNAPSSSPVVTDALATLRKLLAPYRADRHDLLATTFPFSNRQPLDASACVDIRQRLHRIPRQVNNPVDKRASVLIPLCNVNGEASVLFTMRSQGVTHHKGEVCFPGGMADAADQSIIDTALRETDEEIGLHPSCTEVLGVLRCDWTRVEAITGTAVTPVVGFLGDIQHLDFRVNPSEVHDFFTVPFHKLYDPQNWILREGAAPVFTGGDAVIWGLTGYVLKQFMQKVLNVSSYWDGDGDAHGVSDDAPP